MWSRKSGHNIYISQIGTGGLVEKRVRPCYAQDARNQNADTNDINHHKKSMCSTRFLTVASVGSV